MIHYNKDNNAHSSAVNAHTFETKKHKYSINKYILLLKKPIILFRDIHLHLYFIVFGMRLAKYQQIHLDIQSAAQQSLHICLHIDWSPYCTFKESYIHNHENEETD